MSFPLMKRYYYDGSLFDKDSITTIPQVRVSYALSVPYEAAYDSLSNLFDILIGVFSKLSDSYFSKDAFKDELAKEINDKKKAEKITKFVLSTYSRSGSQGGNSTFLQLRTLRGKEDYRVYNTHYLESFAQLLQRFNRFFDTSKSNSVNRYVTNNDSIMIGYTRLGYFIELLDIGTYEMKGGKNPVIFIRLNDPDRIEKDAKNAVYKNLLLQKTLQKFEVSNQIFDYFFCRQFTNEERWSFIEDFFLGADNDDLEKKYTGTNVSNKMDLLEYLKTINPVIQDASCDIDDDEGLNYFLPNPDVWYDQDSMLTIVTQKGKVTRKISEWLAKDPILLDEIRNKNNLKFRSDVFNILVSKVRQNKSYFTETRGLKVRIEFKGYPGLVQASIPYKDKPLEFYKWWCKNEDKVHLSTAEQIQLFLRVKALKPDALLKKHEKMISK